MHFFYHEKTNVAIFKINVSLPDTLINANYFKYQEQRMQIYIS